MSYRIREARIADADALLAIYAPHVENTNVSFELEAPTIEEFKRRIRAGLEHFCYIVAEDTETGEVAGYAYNGSFRSRPAYQWSSELSIYLAPAHQRRGLGSALLRALERLMRLQGVVMSEACITSSNTGSIAFHERHGYTMCGEHHRCGFKRGEWLSVVWMEKQLTPAVSLPEPRHGLTSEEVARALEETNAELAG